MIHEIFRSARTSFRPPLIPVSSSSFATNIPFPANHATSPTAFDVSHPWTIGHGAHGPQSTSPPSQLVHPSQLVSTDYWFLQSTGPLSQLVRRSIDPPSQLVPQSPGPLSVCIQAQLV